MKAASFAYAKARTLDEAFDLLGRHGGDARILAGGQSLIPSLNLRLSAPKLLVDINGLSDLKKVVFEKETIKIGALVTHSTLLDSPEIKKHVPLLAEAVPHVAHVAIRNRGTIGGSLALADPAAEYPAVAVALDAVLILKNRNQERRVPAAKFFKGLFETDLKAGEILAAVEFPAAKAGDRSAFLELTRRHGDYAIVGLAAHARGGDRRFVYFNAGPTPVLVQGTSLADAKENLRKTLKPPADLYNSPATKLHLAGVLMERAWNKITISS